MHGRIQFLVHLATCTDIKLYICMLFNVHFFFQKFTKNTRPTIMNHELPSVNILNYSR